MKDCFKVNSKQKIIIPKKDEYVKFKNYERKMKSPFIIYADFESLVKEDNGKQNLKSLIQKNVKNLLLAVIAC